MINIQEIRLIDILPPNIIQDNKVKAATAALDKELQVTTALINKCLILHRIDELSEPVLDNLAWQLHVDFYDYNLPIEHKRILVKNSLIWHRRKGTPAAVEEIITAIFGDGKVVEWWEYGGEPYYFKVMTTNTQVNTMLLNQFLKVLNSVKNARSRLEAVEITATDEMNLYFGNIVHIADYQEVRQVV